MLGKGYTTEIHHLLKYLIFFKKYLIPEMDRWHMSAIPAFRKLRRRIVRLRPARASETASKGKEKKKVQDLRPFGF